MRVVPPNELEKDKKWKAILEDMTSRYEIPDQDIYRVIYGETVPKWNFESFNLGSKASGAFQFIPSTLDFINKRHNKNYTYQDVLKMEPWQQLQLYDMYLRAWGYEGDIAVGFMQAAPGKYYRMKKHGEKLKPSDIVYEKGSRAWKANPAWRDNNGNITVQSISDYYRR